MSGDATVAGRLEIPVEANLKGFKKKLEEAVDAAARDVAAKIGLTVNDEGFKKKLEETVTKAAEGVTAKIGIDVDATGLKKKLETAAKAAGGIEVSASVESLTEELRKQILLAEARNRDGIDVKTESKGFIASLLASLTKGKAIAKANSIEVDVKTKNKGGGFELPEWAKPKGGAASSFRPIAILGMISLIQPAIAAIGGTVGGLVAMVGNLAQSFSLLGTVPGLFGAMQAAMAVINVSFGGLFGKLSKVPDHLMPIRKEFEKLRPELEKFQKGISGAFWKDLKKDIEPVGKQLMPLLTEGLKGVATEMGQTAKQTVNWMKTPLFKGQLKQVFGSFKVLTGGFGDALLGIAKGLTNVTVAAGPIFQLMAGKMTGFGSWAAGIGDTANEQKRLGDMFKYGWEKATQLWDMTKNLGKTLGAVFKAGKDSGDSLLKSLQDNIDAMRTWAVSGEGQNAMKAWFKAIEPITREAGNLLVDLGKALGRLAVDSHTADLLKSIRTDLLPSLEIFLRNLGSTLGPQVVTFIQNVLEILTKMSDAGGPLATGLGALNTVLEALAAVLGANQGLATNLGALLGALLAWRALTFFSGIVPGLAGLTNFIKSSGKLGWAGAAGGILLLSGRLNDLPGAVTGAVGALSAFAAFMPGLKKKLGDEKSGPAAGLGLFRRQVVLMKDDFIRAGGQIDGFSGKVRGIGSAIGFGAKRGAGSAIGAIGGLVSALGGGWMIAITAATAAVGAYVQAQENARQAAEDFSQTLDKQTGKLTDSSMDNILGKFKSDLDGVDIDRLQGLGINMGEAAKAAGAGGKELEDFITKVQRLSSAQSPNLSPWGGEANDNRDALDGLSSSLRNTGNDVERGKKIWEQWSQAQRDAKAASGELVDGLSFVAGEARRTYGPTSALSDAIDELIGKQMGGRQASRDFGESMNALDAYMKNGKKGISDLTEVGRQNNALLDSSAANTVRFAEEQLKMGRSTDYVTKETLKARGSFIEAAHKMGYSREEAGKLADRLGLTTQKVVALDKKVRGMKTGQTIDIVARTEAAKDAINRVQSLRDGLKDKTITIFVKRRIQNELAQEANGLNTALAHGGIIAATANGIIQRFASGGIRSFANGKLPGEATIARDGSNLVQWAERGTGGEAFIPLSPNRRGRSMAILSQVANEFGMALTPVLDSVATSTTSALATNRAGVTGPGAVASGAPVVTFAPNSINIHNPAAEPASKSLVGTLRSVGDFGLFGEDG